MFASTSFRRVLTVLSVVLLSALGRGSALAEPCNAGADQAGPFSLIVDPGTLTKDLAALVGIRVTNPGPTTWYGENNAPHPFRLGVGGDLDPAGDVIWSGWDCGGYSLPDVLKNQRSFMCSPNPPEPRVVGPNETVDFFFNITVPSSFTGTQAALRVRMVYDAGTDCDGWFGSQVSHLFNVAGSGPSCNNTPLAIPSDRWLLEIWNSRQPQVGDPVERRYDYVGDNGFDFPTGNPSNCVGANDYSARFVRNASFQEGTYRFQYTTDDGMRIYVDGTLVADRWGDPQVVTDSFERFMTPGTHLIEVVWYQATGGAHAAISWAPVGGPPRPPAPTGLSAAGGTNEIGLGWIASTGTGITGYNVYRRPLSGSYTSIGCQFTDATHCRDTGLPAATDFCYQV